MLTKNRDRGEMRWRQREMGVSFLGEHKKGSWRESQRASLPWAFTAEAGAWADALRDRPRWVSVSGCWQDKPNEYMWAHVKGQLESASRYIAVNEGVSNYQPSIQLSNLRNRLISPGMQAQCWVLGDGKSR